MRRLSFPQLLIVLLIALAPLRPLSAQVATPPPGSDITPYVPDPALCTIKPINRQILLDLWFPEDGTPVPPGVIASTDGEVTLLIGPAADTTTTEAITETLHSFYDCVAAADFTRYLAYFTDDMIQRFGPDPFP